MLRPQRHSRHAVRSANGPSLWVARWLRAAVALLMLWVSVMPALSHAMLAAGGDAGRLVQVCSSSGMAWITVDGEDGGDDSTHEGVSGDGHCAWCLSHATDAAAPKATVAVGMLPPAAQQQRALCAPVRRADDAPPSASPRGPPRLPR